MGYADLIAVGTIEEILFLPPESVEHRETLADGERPVEMKLRVSEYLKGSTTNPILLYSPAFFVNEEQGRIVTIGTSRTSCGSFYKLGTSYVMFMKNSDSLRYTPTGLYGGTQEYSNDQQSVDYLAQIRAAVANPGFPPTGSGPPHHSPPSAPLAAAAALAAIGLAANATVVLRRR